jgi:hypothetical protein
VGDDPGHSATLRSPWRLVVALAERQWGVVALAQLAELGIPPATVRSWVRRGRLIPLHRGVCAVGHAQLRAEGHWLAAVLACGPGAALSHASAAAHLDLRSSSARVVHVSVPVCRRGHRGVVVHRPRSLDGDVRIHDGILTTTPTRTLIDLAEVLPLRALERTAARAEARGLLDHDRLATARSRAIRAIFGSPRGPQHTRSEDEARFLAAVRAAGLPEPEMNAWLTHGGGEEWQADALWRRGRLIVEIDDDSHRTRHAFEVDRAKDAARQADGYATLRFTRRRVREDLPAVVGQVATVLAARASV